MWGYSIPNNKWVRKYGGTVFTSGIFGEKGISSGLNVVRSRYGGVSWQDTIGNFWIFGGIYDYDFNSQTDCFNDLWRYVPDTACGVFTSTNEIGNKSNRFTIYPNPVGDIVNIISPSFETSQIILRNSIGGIVLRKNISGNDVVDVSNLPTGLYYISISNQAGLFSHKLIISR